MGCIAIPPFPPLPPLPPGVSIPGFVLPLPTIGFCCSIELPTFAIPAIPIPIPFLPGVITALNGYLAAMSAYFDALMPSCPLQ